MQIHGICIFYHTLKLLMLLTLRKYFVTTIQMKMLIMNFTDQISLSFPVDNKFSGTKSLYTCILSKCTCILFERGSITDNNNYYSIRTLSRRGTITIILILVRTLTFIKHSKTDQIPNIPTKSDPSYLSCADGSIHL